MGGRGKDGLLPHWPAASAFDRHPVDSSAGVRLPLAILRLNMAGMDLAGYRMKTVDIARLFLHPHR